MHISRKEQEDGFALIELVIVVVIIGILTAVAIPSYRAIQHTARVNTLHSANSQYMTAFKADRATNGEGKNATAGQDIEDYGSWDSPEPWTRVHHIKSVSLLRAMQNGYTGSYDDYESDGAYCAATQMKDGDTTIRRIDGDPICHFDIIGLEEG